MEDLVEMLKNQKGNVSEETNEIFNLYARVLKKYKDDMENVEVEING